MMAASGLLCPIRAQVPLAEALSQHAQHDSGLAFALFIPVPRRAVRYQLQGWARADAIALTDPVVLVGGGGGDVDLVEVVFDAARSGGQQSRGGPAPGREPVRGPGWELPAAADG